MQELGVLLEDARFRTHAHTHACSHARVPWWAGQGQNPLRRPAL